MTERSKTYRVAVDADDIMYLEIPCPDPECAAINVYAPKLPDERFREKPVLGTSCLYCGKGFPVNATPKDLVEIGRASCRERVYVLV